MNPSLLTRQLFPLWLGMTLIAAVPFLSRYRVGPISSFFLESGSLTAALLFALLSAWHGLFNRRPPMLSIYLWLSALLWAVQARLMHLTYPGMSDMVSWTFVILGFMAWACRGWLHTVGQERAVSVLAWVLMWAGCLQALVAWLQFSGVAAHVSHLLMYRQGIVEGQLGQYNHLAHYLMWAILSVTFLWIQRRLSAWLALPALLYLGMTIAITGSRSVFAYLAVLSLLAALWRLWAGKSANRAAACLLAAVAAVAVLQFATAPILELLTGHDLKSAAERLANEQFGRSGRSHEWQKAWQAFLSAPWFGHGWGSYPLQGFLSDHSIYQDGFRRYDPNVLFTHSHNSLLNLLAEMGITGTLWILGGLAWAVRGCLKRPCPPAGLFLLAAMSVSLSHSLLEYPLWYIYFLTAFFLFPALMPPPTEEAVTEPQPRHNLNLSAALCCLLLLCGVLRLVYAYQTFRHADSSSKTKTERIMALLHIVNTEPMLKYYAQLKLSNHVDTAADSLPEWGIAAVRDSAVYRPYAYAYKWGLVAHRSGDTDTARRWLRQTYRYYPHQLHIYGHALMQPHYTALRDDYTELCQAYRRIEPRAQACAEWLPPIPPAAASAEMLR